MDATASATPLFDALIDALRRKDDPNGELARSVFLRLGGDVVEFLVAEAVAPRRHPNYRIRLLEVVLAIGEPLGPREFLLVSSLLRQRSSRVREIAVEVLVSLNCPIQSYVTSARLRSIPPSSLRGSRQDLVVDVEPPG